MEPQLLPHGELLQSDPASIHRPPSGTFIEEELDSPNYLEVVEDPLPREHRAYSEPAPREHQNYSESGLFSERSRAFSSAASPPSFHRPFPPRPHAELMGSRSHFPRNAQASQVKGLYLVKFAVSVTACYLALQLLINFAEVLLPFIFAVLCMIILEPLKKFIMRIFQRLAVLLFQRLGWNACLELGGSSATRQNTADEGYRSDGEVITLYGRLPQESIGEDAAATANLQPVAVPAPAVKRMVLVFSILFCLILTGRVLWLTAKVFLRAGYSISGNLDFYKQGSARLKTWFQMWISDMHMGALDYEEILDGLVTEVETLGTVVTENVLYTVLQAVVTFIFLIYMLWSPIKMESSTLTGDVFRATSRYLKVKCIISAFTGLSVAVILWAIGLDLPAAFGLLTFLANFLPGIGSFVASVLPCVLAVIDVRQTPTKVLLAFVCQLAVHFCVDFVIEPVFFGISVEIHSVIVILGIWFFYQVWGVPGMLLSVPLLAVLRIMMKSMKHASRTSASSGAGEDADTIVFLDNILEGRWMSSVGEQSSEQELELADFAIYQPKESPPAVAGDLHGDSEASWLQKQRAVPDLWVAFYESHVGSEMLRLYDDYRLIIDLMALFLGTSIVLFLPL